jgi:hypothetical protein
VEGVVEGSRLVEEGMVHCRLEVVGSLVEEEVVAVGSLVVVVAAVEGSHLVVVLEAVRKRKPGRQEAEV